MYSVKDIIQDYNSVVKVIDKDASKQNSRAYGGVIKYRLRKIARAYNRRNYKNCLAYFKWKSK